MALVQDPATAKFDGMPRSAVDAGLADIVAPVEELPGKIMAYLQRTPLMRSSRERCWKTRPRAPWIKPSFCCAPTPATIFRSIRRTPFIAGSSGAWASTRSTPSPSYVQLPAGEPAGIGFAVQGAIDRRDEFLPRSAPRGSSLRDEAAAGAAGDAARRACAARVGAGLLDRRGGLFAGHRLQGSDGESSSPEASSACRSLPPTWTRTPSTKPARAFFPPISPPMYRRSG